MQALQPLPDDYANRFVKMRYHGLYVGVIEKLAKKLNQSLKPSMAQGFIQSLNNKAFWEALKQAHPLNEDIDNLEALWLQIKPFAHLSTRELLKTYSQTLRPLEQALLRAFFEVDADLKHYHQYGIWRAQWYLKRQVKMKQILEKRLEVLDSIKTALLKSLAARGTLYQKLDLERHDDNFLEAFSNSLGGLTKLKVKPKTEKTTISDDERLEIFDILASHFPKQRDSLNPIVKDVRKALFEPLVDVNEHQKQSQAILKNVAKIEKANEINSVSKLKKAKELEKQQKAQDASWMQKLKGYVGSMMLVKGLYQLYRMRYVLLTAITMILFIAFAPVVVSPIALYSQTLANWVTGALLVGFGLAPAWVGAWHWIKGAYQRLANTICYNKCQSLHQALEAIKDNQRLITQELTSGIHDTAHVDLSALNHWHKDIKAQAKMIEPLLEYGPLESLFASKALTQGLKQAKEMLLAQKKDVDSRFKSLASHVTKRVGQDITKLVYRANKGFEVAIEKGQLKRLGSYIKQYGSQENLKSFDECCTLEPQFAQSLFDRKHLVKGHVKTTTPWGGFKPFKSSLEGWRCLFKALNKLKFNSLLDVLEGKSYMSVGELKSCIGNLAEKDGSIIPAIQNHLFACLEYLPIECVHLLSVEQKRLIRDWFDHNQDNISNAFKALRLFTREQKIEDKGKIDECVILLDGAQIASTLMNKTDIPYDIARKAIKTYNGQNPKTVYLIRFFSEHEKDAVCKQLSSKRLEYLLNHPKTEITKTDLQIFISIRHLIGTGFDFAGFVKKHPSFSKPWNKAQESLLKTFRDNGLDDGTLLKLYRKLNTNIKSYKSSIPSMIEPSRPGVLFHA